MSVSTSPGKRYKIASLRYWEIKMMPAEKKEYAGHLIPTFRGSISKFGFKGKSRRIAIETYTPHTPEEAAQPQESSISNERSFNKMMAGRSSKAGIQADSLGEDDIVIFRMFKARPTTATVAKNTVDDGQWGKSEPNDEYTRDAVA